MTPRALILSLLLLAGHAQAASITLLPAARVAPGAPVTLADVATLEGEQARALAHVVIIPAAGDAANPATPPAGASPSWTVIRHEQVRAALEHAGATLGTVSLSGNVCEVRFRAAPAERQAPAPTPDQPRVHFDPAAPTLRREITRSVCALLGVPPDELRLEFDARDEPLLDIQHPGRRIAVQTVSTSHGAALGLHARVIEGDRLIENRSLRVRGEVLRSVVILQSDLARGDVISPEILTESRVWVPLGGTAPLTRTEDAAGSLARTRLTAGTLLRREHTETPVIVRRNELVTVHALRAGFEVTTRARARSDARMGDVIEFTSEGSRKAFVARVAGPGVAVADLDDAPSTTPSSEARPR
ncbi:MAG: flagellar basal body P-ring formation chaperone FlgA [Planctomycetota bacterium]|nr:flagellar basal body P-ring formation chaperone FlgA [Planctomycetota bacterium]